MAIDPLDLAASAYVSANRAEAQWREFGRDTGTSDIISSHPRLYRSLTFGDDDYPEAAAYVLGRILREGVEKDSGEKGRMELLADSMPDLPTWIAKEAPPRTRRLFNDYIAGRAISEIPQTWLNSHYVAAPPPDEDAITNLLRMEPPTAEIQAPPPVSKITESRKDDVTPSGASAPGDPHAIFIVHGHDEAARDSIRICVHDLTGILPISLAEQPGGGATIIEKFEKYGGQASCVVVLLTPDDVGNAVGNNEAGLALNPRARQNVVLELGYFIGKIGRETSL